MSDNVTLKVSEVVPALTARTQLGQILDRISENGERFLINRHGAPTAVILSVEDYVGSILKEPELLDKLQKLHQKARAVGLDKLTMSEIDAEVEATRKGLKKSKKCNSQGDGLHRSRPVCLRHRQMDWQIHRWLGFANPSRAGMLIVMLTNTKKSKK